MPPATTAEALADGSGAPPGAPSPSITTRLPVACLREPTPSVALATMTIRTEGTVAGLGERARSVAPLVANLDFGSHLSQGDIVYWFAILVSITLQTSFLTPPMGLALFYMKGVAPPTVSMNQIYRGIIPFVMLQMLCVALVMIWPQIAMWLPHQLFD